MKRTTLFITSLVLIVGCSKTVDENKLVERSGLKYEVNTDKPFSGKTFITYENGQNKVEGSWKSGIKDGLWTYYSENGSKDSSGTYKDRVIDGLWTWWYGNGQKYSEGTYKEGERVGLWTDWYSNGEKSSEGTYLLREDTGKDRELDGLWTSWYGNGQKNSEVTYKDGKLISEECWEEDGNGCECESGEKWWKRCK